MKIPGNAVRILSVSPKNKGTLRLNERELAKILLDKDIRDKHVAVIAIVGPSRKGKSLLMNFLLRYMTAVYVQGDCDWLRDDGGPLEGFRWSGGSAKVTAGIELWSHPFLVEVYSNQEVAVLFLDTQGTFDQESSLAEDTAIFALSTLCSSLLIYNLSCDILSVDLMHLELFLSYGLEAVNRGKHQQSYCDKDSSNTKPFHKLLFLIRDYAFKNEYGEEEGNKHMMKRFKTDNEEVKQIVSNVTRCFSDVTCFAMPPVGLKTARHENPEGKITEIDPQFIVQLKRLAPSLLQPNNLVMKEVAGELLTARQLFVCFKSYSSVFNSGVLPQPKSIFDATAEINNLLAVDKAKELYLTLMDTNFGPKSPYSVPSKLENKHQEAKCIAISTFRGVVKMGGDKYSRPYEEKLDRDLERMAVTFRRHNNRKNVARMFRTPMIFLVISLLCYVLSNLFGLLGHKRLVKSCNVVMAVSVATLVLMVFVRIQQIIGLLE